MRGLLSHEPDQLRPTPFGKITPDAAAPDDKIARPGTIVARAEPSRPRWTTKSENGKSLAALPFLEADCPVASLSFGVASFVLPADVTAWAEAAIRLVRRQPVCRLSPPQDQPQVDPFSPSVYEAGDGFSRRNRAAGDASGSCNGRALSRTLACFDKALALNPDQLKRWVIAAAYWGAGPFDEALADCDRA